MKALVGKELELHVQGLGPEGRPATIVCEMLEDKGTIIRVKHGKKILHIPKRSICLYAVTEEDQSDKNKVWIYMCKNDITGCKGTKCLSAKDNLSLSNIPCGSKGECECDFGKVGNFFDLPKEIQAAFLEGLRTIPPPAIGPVVKKSGIKVKK